jgi:hypothetical protein
MTRTMYDGVTPSRLPPSASMVAGYADGHYANLAAMRARYPHATVVSIAVSWRTRAQVLDVETGDATPAQAVQWCLHTMAGTANRDLTVYCNTSTWPSVRAAFRAAGVSEPQYWVAEYDGVAAIPAGAVAKQYRNTPGYDVSVVVAAGGWHGVDPTTPAPTPTPEDDMTPAQAAQLDDLHADLMSIKRVGPIDKAEKHGAGFFLAVGEAHAHEASEKADLLLAAVTALTATVDTLAAEVAALKAGS